MWREIGSVPVNTWVLARIVEPGFSFIPSVVSFDTDVGLWTDSGREAGNYLIDWNPTEWHPLPPENEENGAIITTDGVATDES